MGGLFLDIYIEWLIRMIVKLVHRAASREWPATMAKIRSASKCDSVSAGLTLICVQYSYSVDGEAFEGTHKEPFVIRSLGEDYIHRFPAKAETPIRTKPGFPDKSFLVRG